MLQFLTTPYALSTIHVGICELEWWSPGSPLVCICPYFLYNNFKLYLCCCWSGTMFTRTKRFSSLCHQAPETCSSSNLLTSWKCLVKFVHIFGTKFSFHKVILGCRTLFHEPTFSSWKKIPQKNFQMSASSLWNWGPKFYEGHRPSS